MRIPIIKPSTGTIMPYVMPFVEDILVSGMLSNVDKNVKRFEKKISEYVRVKTVAVSSCTSGLILTLQALGIREKEVIVPSFTFAATLAAVYWTRNKWVYADIDDTFTLDPEEVRARITENTSAIIGVHMYGNPCHIKELEEIAEENDLKLIFDAAHAIGSEYQNEHIGKFGDAEVFSFSPTKLITTVEGGAVTTSNKDLYEKLRILRNYGIDSDYQSELPGLNARMSEVHAAVGLAQVDLIDKLVNNRNEYVQWYKDRLYDFGKVYFQEIEHGNISAHKDFSIVLDRRYFERSRDRVISDLAAEGIQAKRYFYPPMHKVKAYEDKTAKLPMTSTISYNLISLPIHNYMFEEMIDDVCEIIKA